MSTSFEVNISPAVFQRIRENSGWTIEKLAESIKIEAEIIEAWEKGQKKPTYAQLQKIGKEIKKSPAMFLLSTPPKQYKKLTDFRMLPNSRQDFSKETLFAIAHTINLQEIAAELRVKLDIDGRYEIPKATLQDNPEKIAQRERSNLGIKLFEQISEWSDEHMALRKWRLALENKGILTFQFPLPISDARGFSLTEIEPYAVVISNKDMKQARIFTLLHEYGHILLREQGICIPREKRKNSNGVDAVEVWCNKFAAEMLLPRGAVYQDLAKIAEDSKTWYKKVKTISNRYKVSKLAVLTRMLGLELISPDKYKLLTKRSGGFEKKEMRKKKGGGGANKGESPIIKQRGRAFVSLVVAGSKRGLVSTRDALGYLSTNIKEFQKISS